MMWNRSSKKSSKEKFTSAQQAYDCALNLLSYRDFSKQKMQERLQQKGADEEQAEEAIEKLESYGLINDERYAGRVFEAWLNKRCYGRQHLAAELNKRGLAPELAQEVLARFTPELEAEHAANAVELFCQRHKDKIAQAQRDDVSAQDKLLFNKKIYGAAGRFLASRGFSSRYMSILWEKIMVNNEI
ncbi:MAG: regulatory protein RecX [Phascolarctobacterium sp.]